jgi:hypothetical protein
VRGFLQGLDDRFGVGMTEIDDPAAGFPDSRVIHHGPLAAGLEAVQKLGDPLGMDANRFREALVADPRMGLAAAAVEELLLEQPLVSPGLRILENLTLVGSSGGSAEVWPILERIGRCGWTENVLGVMIPHGASLPLT